MCDSAPFRGVWKVLAFSPLRLIVTQSGPIWMIKIAIIFISFSMTRSCSLQKLLADLGVNVIVVTMLAKHCSYRPMARLLLF